MIPKMSHKFLLIWVLLGTVLLSGCWDHKETGDLALVMGMGIDKTEDDLYQVSFQIVNPGRVAGGKTGQGQGAAVTTYSETGKTILETIRKVTQKAPRLLTFSHTGVLIIGEDLAAEEGLKKIFDFIERYHDFRSTTLVLIAKGGEAKSILSILSPLERIPAIKIQEIIEKSEQAWGESPERNINDVAQMLSGKSKGLSLGGIELVGDLAKGQSSAVNMQATPDSLVKVNGLALFKDGKLRGWFEGEKARGVAWVQNNVNRAILSANCNPDEGAMAAEILRTHTRWQPKVVKGKPKITLNIRAEGQLADIACAIDLSNPDNMSWLDKRFAAEIKQEVTKAVEAAQEQNNDIFGFGEAINRADPKAWKKMKKNWSESFADMDFQVNVKVFIRGTGLRKEPLILKKK